MKKNQGITLIALVITIIVLIILSGVSIALLTGENGIITKAKDASDQTQLSEEKERVTLVASELKMDKVQGNDVDKNAFQTIVDGQFGTGNATGDKNENTYIITVEKTQNVYTIDENGNIGNPGKEEDANKKDDNPGILEGSGTEENPYTINSIEDLVAFSYNVNSGTNMYLGNTVALGRCLYFDGSLNSYANPNSKYEYVDKIGYQPKETSTKTIKELVTTDKGFVPISSGEIYENIFKGNFNGKNNYIDGIYINSGDNDAGLFGNIYGDEGISITNFGLNSGSISGGYAGGIIAYLGASKVINIQNCYNKADVGGSGLIGKVSASAEMLNIENCYNTGNVEKSGLVGEINGTKKVMFKNCYNTAKINSGYSGFVNYINTYSSSPSEPTNEMTVENCYNTGEGNLATSGLFTRIESKNIKIKDTYNEADVQNGGIADEIYGDKISLLNCYNKGNIYGTDVEMGGLIGRIGESISKEILIENCYNKGNFSGTSNYSYRGGIVGTTTCTDKVTISNSYNNGNISGQATCVGGIVGSIMNEGTSNITNCINTGGFEQADEAMGGIAGQIGNNINLTNCYNFANLGVKSSNSIKGGIIAMAQNVSANLNNCYNYGNVLGGSSPEGGIVGNFDGMLTLTGAYNRGDINKGDFSGEFVGSYPETKLVLNDCCYLTKANNANSNGGTGKTEVQMNVLMSVENFVNEMNAKVDQNNSNDTNSKWKKWKVENGTPIFAQ